MRTQIWLLALVVLPAMALGNDTVVGLEAALRAALTQHPSMAGKRAQVRAKDFAGDVARAQRYPTITAKAAANHNSTNPIGVQARQPLWDFGRIDAGIAFAQADKTAEEADLLRVQRQLLEQTAVAYTKVLGARARLGVADENLRQLTTLLNQIQRREQGQLASKADVRLAQTRLIQAQSQQSRFASELDTAQSDLLALTRLPVTATVLVRPSLTALGPALEIEKQALEEAAELRFKAHRVDLARADVEREKTASMPTFYLQGDKSFKNPEVRDGTVIGITFEMTLDAMGFAARGRSQAASARLLAAQEDLNSSRIEVERTVRNWLDTRRLQQGLIDILNNLVSGQKELFASYQRQYDAGSKTWLDLLNMQRELNEQHLQKAQADNEWLIASLKLAALTGRLDQVAR